MGQTRSCSSTRRGVGATLLVMGLLASACSSSKSGTGTSSGDGQKASKAVPVGKPLTTAEAADATKRLLGPIKYATGTTTRGIDGKVITIGGVADVKDATGLENFPGVCEAAKARFMRANREGGVNGYTFKYVGCSDTGGNPDTTRLKTQDMVEKEKVFALVPKISTLGNMGAYLNKQKVPYFGWGVDPDYCGWSDRQFGFSVTSAITCSDVVKGKTFFSSLGLNTYVSGTHKKPADVKWALVGSNDAVSAGAIKAFNSIATAAGSNVAYKTSSLPAQGSPPLSDYTPLAQAIVSSGATATYMIVPANTIFALLPALRANGFKGDTVIPFADARLLAVVNQIDKTYAETPNIGSVAFPSKQFSQISTDMKAIGSKAPADGLGTVMSYVAADLFIKVLEKTKAPLTAESFAKTINSGYDYPQYGNVLCGSNWPAAHAVPANCSALVQFSASKKAILPIADMSDTGKTYLFSSR